MADYPSLSDLPLVSTLDAIPQMCFIYRDDGLLVALNCHCEQLLGVPRAALVGTFNLFEHPEMIDGELRARYQEAFRGVPQVVPAIELPIGAADLPGPERRESVFWVETILVPLAHRDDGSAPYVLGIQRDVTELMGVRREI